MEIKTDLKFEIGVIFKVVEGRELSCSSSYVVNCIDGSDVETLGCCSSVYDIDELISKRLNSVCPL